MPLAVNLFCYSFFVGIALSMGLPTLRLHWIPILFLGAILAAIAGIAALPRHRPNAVVQLQRPLSTSLLRLSLVLSGLFLGYARHASTFDDYGSPVHLTPASATPSYAPLAHFSLRLDRPAPTQLTYLISGRQHCLYPITDTNNVPLMDASGRWRFSLTNRATQCSLTIPAGASSASLPLPFSTVSSIQPLHAPTNTSAPPLPTTTLLRHPNRIEDFASPRAPSASFSNPQKTTILGRIYSDPDVYHSTTEEGAPRPRTVLELEPAFVQPLPGEPFYPIESGRIQVSLNGAAATDSMSASAAHFNDLLAAVSQTSALGNDLVLRGSLEIPQSALNPDGFDYRSFLLSRGIGAQLYLAPWQLGFGPILHIVSPEQAPTPRHGNPFVMASLHLRDRMFDVIKRTLPYPQSAYVAGIALGMRSGLQNAECILSDSPENNVQTGARFLHRLLPHCQDFISDEFKRAGVNHVLAVSGLHVTIITALLVGLFSLCRIHRRYFVPFVLLALVVFSIITGARPSTLRAVIMNGLFLILWAYLRESVKTSVLLAAAVAGFVILLQNPRLLIEPSFTLSFGAILSLGLLTTPCTRVLNRFRGNDLLALALSLILFHALLAFGWFRVAAPRAAALLALAIATLFAAGRLANRFNLRPIRNYSFAHLPTPISGFLAAQFAIQLGMMIPLSAYYFARWPVIGSVANLIAIPLIGIILQLSILACLIGLIPFVGPLIALLLNAANWLGCVLFMLVAHFASSLFPYPFVSKPSGLALALYYALLALAVLWPHLRPKLSRTTTSLALAATLALAAAFLPHPTPPASPTASILSVGYGSATLYRTPSGENILFDSAYTQPSRSRISQAERAILPHLSSLSIRSLDALVLLSHHPERIGGAALILEQCRVKHLILPPALAACFDPHTNALRPEALDALLPTSGNAAIREARAAILGPSHQSASIPSLAAILAARRPSPLNRALGIDITILSSDSASLPYTTLLPDTPTTCAALLHTPSSALLLAGDTNPSQLSPWLAQFPSIRAISLPFHGLASIPTPTLQTLAQRNGYAILETGSLPASLRRAVPHAAASRRETLASCTQFLPQNHTLATDREGATHFLLP